MSHWCQVDDLLPVFWIVIQIKRTLTVWKVSKYRFFSGPYFPVFGLNTEIYSGNIRIQSENTDQIKLRTWALVTQCLRSPEPHVILPTCASCSLAFSIFLGRIFFQKMNSELCHSNTGIIDKKSFFDDNMLRS